MEKKMKHNTYYLLTVTALNAFVCGAVFASGEVEDDGHGDLHRSNTKTVVLKNNEEAHVDDDHGDVHCDPVNKGNSAQNQRLQSHL